jgi:hypothetical protein
MGLPRPRHWLRSVLVLLGLTVVVPGWFIALIVDRIASLRPRRLPSRYVLLISFVVVLATGCLIAAIDGGIHPLVSIGSIPIVSFFALLVAKVLSSDARGEDPLEQPFPKTTWRLYDAELSTSGVWRAEIEFHPSGIDDFGDLNLVEPYVRSLIRDWSFRSGWPYLDCPVLEVSQVSPGRTGPFSSVSEWWTVYRVTLGVDVGYPKCGWLRFGDGFAEFQLEPHAPTVTTRLIVGERKEVISFELPAAEKAKSEDDRELTQILAGLQHPLWDRWLDG